MGQEEQHVLRLGSVEVVMCLGQECWRGGTDWDKEQRAV